MDRSSQSTDWFGRYSNGIAFYRNGQYSQAIDELSPILDRGDLPGRIAKYYYAMAHRQMGVAALGEGDFPQAQACLRTAIDMLGRQDGLSNYLAAVYAKTGRYEQCAAQLDSTSQPGSQAASAKSLALAQWQAGQRAVAYMTLTAAIRKDPSIAPLHFQLGVFYAAEERYDQAREAFIKACDGDCTDGRTHYYLGLVCAADGDPLGAVRHFQRALELCPTDLMLAYQLAMAARAANQGGACVTVRMPEASAPAASESRTRQLADFIASEADFVEAFLDLPVSDADNELFALLDGTIQMALAEHPGYADLHYYRSRVLRRLGRPADALANAVRAVEINPRYVKALLELALLREQSGQMEQAVMHVEHAIACGGDWPDLHCQAARLQQGIGRLEDARRHLQRALELKSDFAPAVEALALLAA